MYYKQCKFSDGENIIHGGLIDLETNDIICGCCGSVFKGDELEDDGIKIIKIYKHWIDLDTTIIEE